MGLLVNFSTVNAPFTTYQLAFSLNPGPNTQNVSFAIIAESNGKVINKKFISRDAFIRVATGQEVSSANPGKENLFDKFEISEGRYLWTYDSIKDRYEDIDVLFIEDSWVLKYGRNPLCPGGCLPGPGMKIDGWAQYNFRPSWPQLQILQEYGVVYVNDFFYGENMFKLLHDMEDPSWIEAYKDAADPPETAQK